MKMKMKIDGLNGFEVDGLELWYFGKPCAMLSDTSRECGDELSYRGSLVDRWTTYRTPVGIVERHYWARVGLRAGVDWRLLVEGAEIVLRPARQPSQVA